MKSRGCVYTQTYAKRLSSDIGGVFILIYPKQVSRTVGSAIAPQVPPSPVKESTLRFLIKRTVRFAFQGSDFESVQYT